MSFYRSNVAGTKYSTLQAAANAVTAGDVVTGDPGNATGFQLSSTPPKGVVFDLTGITINAVGGSHGGIDFESAGDVTVKNGRFIGLSPYPLRMVNVAGASILNNYNEGSETGFYVSHGNGVTIKGNESCFNHAPAGASAAGLGHGCYVTNSLTNAVIEDNYWHDNVGCGQHINGDASQGDTGICSGFTVQGNILARNGGSITYGGVSYAAGGGSALNCDGLQNSYIADNEIYGNSVKAICLYGKSGGGDSSGDSTGNTIVNNTVLAGTVNWLQINTGSSCTEFNNITQGQLSNSGTVKSSNDVVANSSTFISGGYTLAAGSNAIGKGIASFNGQTAPTTDINGVKMNVPPDCGCNAYAGTTPPVQVLTSIEPSPATATLSTGATQQFTAQALDQNGNPMNPQPTFTWSALQGKITSGGLYTAPAAAGSDVVTVSSGSVKATVAVTVTAVAPPNQVATSISLTATGLQLNPIVLDQNGKAMATQPTASQFTQNASGVELISSGSGLTVAWSRVVTISVSYLGLTSNSVTVTG